MRCSALRGDGRRRGTSIRRPANGRASVRARERATSAQVGRGLGARGCGLPGRGRFETGLYASGQGIGRRAGRGRCPCVRWGREDGVGCRIQGCGSTRPSERLRVGSPRTVRGGSHGRKARLLGGPRSDNGLAGYLWSGRASAWVRVVDLTVMAVRRSGTGSGRVVRGVKVRLSVSSRAGSARSWT